jgi:hypothetical protein
MLEILKKAGVASGVATVIVLAITCVPIYFQYKYTVEQNARIEALEKKLEQLEQK